MKKTGFLSWNRWPLLPYLVLFLVTFLPCLAGNQFFYGGDLPTFAVWREFMRDHLAQGQFPLWNPYYWGGFPFFAHPDAMAAYPLLYPFLLFSIPWGITLFTLVHFLLAALGTRFWLRSLGVKESSCFLGAAAYALSGFAWWEIIHPPVLAAYAWFPWLLGNLEALAQERTPSRAFKAGLCFALLFLCGSFQITLGALYAGGFYLAIRVWPFRWKVSLEKLAVLLSALVWGALPLLALLIPFGELLRLSDRVQTPLDFFKFNASLSLDPKTLGQFLFPVNPFSPTELPQERWVGNAGFLGLGAPLFLFWGFRAQKTGLRWLLAALGIFFFLVSLGVYFPLFSLLCRWAPGFFATRASFRFLFVTLACASVLLAWGNGWLEERRIHPGTLRTLRLAFLLSLILAGWRSCPSRLGPASNLDFKRPLPLLEKFKSSAGDGRILLEDGSLRVKGLPYPVNATCLFQLRNALGYAPFGTAKTSRLLAQTPTETWSRLMAAKGYVVMDKIHPASLDPVIGGIAESLPYVYAPQNVEWITDENETLRRMGQKDFHPLNNSFAAGFPEKRPAPVGFPRLSYGWLKDSSDEESFALKLSRDNLVVFSEIHYPGWKAWLDGKPAPLLTANYLFRALWVPSGNHRVDFRYEPAWSLYLPWLLGIWLLVTLIFRKQLWKSPTRTNAEKFS